MKSHLFWRLTRGNISSGSNLMITNSTTMAFHCWTHSRQHFGPDGTPRFHTLSDFLQVAKDAACELCLRAKQHTQERPATVAASKLVLLEKLCIDVSGTPDESYSVLVVDHNSEPACGLGVTTKSMDSTLSFN